MPKKSLQSSAVIASLLRFRVLIRGLPPGLIFQSKGRMEYENEHAGDKGAKGAKKMSYDEEARLLCHWTTVDGKKVPALPSVALYKSVCKAASGHKIGRKTAAGLVASTISFDGQYLPLTSDMPETFVDWVRIPPRTGAMVQIGRPLFREWACEFTLVVDGEEYDPKKLSAEQALRPILRDSGKLVGLGANRPELKGPNGRFVVEAFELEG